MSEHYHVDHRSKQRLRRTSRWLAVFLGCALLIVIIWVLVTSVFFVQREEEPPTSTLQTSVQAPSVSIFRTPYFQFQASDKWVEDAKVSKDEYYVYRSYRGDLIEHDLQIYINPKPQEIANIRASRVQVVDPEDIFLRPLGDISGHCGEKFKKENQDPREIKFKDVTFTCLVDGSIFDVLIGQKGGTHVMKMTRPDGSIYDMVMYYRDLRFSPDGREFEQIVESFQTR